MEQLTQGLDHKNKLVLINRNNEDNDDEKQYNQPYRSRGVKEGEEDDDTMQGPNRQRGLVDIP